MNDAELIAMCEAGFASVAFDSKHKDSIELSSGGSDVPGDEQLRTEPAALYATEALAFAAWKSQFDAAAGDRGARTLIWIEKPYVETYRITLGDSYGTFRVVRDRYVVRGKIAIEYEPIDKHDFDNGNRCTKCAATWEEICDHLKPKECPGVALTNAAHPEGTSIAEDHELSESSIETIEVDADELKAKISASKGLKIKSKCKPKAV